ncbi:tetraacyldisaccharide 4'-kinase [Desulfatirhabdium butyrativorans]|uniref:tetraacyldisaccharide 4'-kinase n=1 Tax=Desulfatirhabdium butyrativorans TaxID=340467 RepID=UPI000405CFA4|nr:tetraacyldisaccharide 4'-kinase [Desulfatirhabdium butyrativorans]
MLQKFIHKVEAVITGKSRAPALEIGLEALSTGYGMAVSLRRRLYEKGFLPQYRLPCFVISVGNITVGGTGKTPMVMRIANLLTHDGFRVAVLSRGYGGRAETAGTIVSDGNGLIRDAALAGDEPVLISRSCPGVPVLAGKNRIASGKLACERFHPDCIVLDDGFQHLALDRDVDIVLLDVRQPAGNGHLLPRGPLREPLAALRSADAFVLTRNGSAGNSPAQAPDGFPLGKPIFRSNHRELVRALIHPGQTIDFLPAAGEGDSNSGLISGRRVYRFSGIADNARVDASIEKLGATVAGNMDFRDHHLYDDREIAAIEAEARRCHAGMLVTTEKDAVRLMGRAAFSIPLAILGIVLEMVPKDRFLFENWLLRLARAKTGKQNSDDPEVLQLPTK